ncbi:VOC family protein [Oceanobacillus sp. CAU 1775]
MLEIDHIVIASKNPEADAAKFGEMFSLDIVPGGRHTNWGTYNYLAFFENNSYIEWIGVFDETLARTSDNPLIQQLIEKVDLNEYGPFTFALRTNKMDASMDHFGKNNFSYEGPFPGSRKRVDGSTLSWRMLFPTEKKMMPFLIEWGEQINQPEDKSKINNKQIASIIIPHTLNIDEDVYQLSRQGDMSVLGNGTLEFTEEAALDFVISSSEEKNTFSDETK